ncbi:hypothetical protein PHYSODRAFT_299876 [Phytophthora sojae]|uniref:Uncharacterized protein n=1 Tax=Phytophthora sojae (strain P6497) TaxID=1094619 RepID=G4ZBD2_PHYSP|nr:hypothetical protein PHYSODRAFT_299876 [Phytophthora sojae]EGZ22728.1 hypothetical protein PHYSODRAFT_299876 [Phytophthora sojae]|eukprot:XP_009525445.1 hypothetical protein PHYSODRAFT_299876 [Phytophthora sojae]
MYFTAYMYFRLEMLPVHCSMAALDPRTHLSQLARFILMPTTVVAFTATRVCTLLFVQKFGGTKMEYVKSVRSALRPRTLFASACPVLMTASLLYKSHGVSLLQLDALAALGCAVLTQLLGNLSAVYSNFQRTLQPKQPGAADGKIILNPSNNCITKFDRSFVHRSLLSLTQVRRWSFLFYGIQLALLGVTHVICDKSVEVTGGMALLVTLALIYCRRGEEPLPMVGLREVVVAWALGPVAMLSTSVYLIGEVPWAVVLYAYLVMLFAWAFLVLESARDAPFARRMGRSDTSLALRLGFQWSFQGFLLLMVSFYGMLLVLGIAMGHLGNFLLVVSIVKLKDISEEFRLERLNHLPDKFARLASFLGVGLIISILAGLS